MAILGKKKKSAAKESAGKSGKKAVVTGTAATVMLQPMVTEKSIGASAVSNTFVFRVKPSSTKHMIIDAVNEKYGVVPAAVRTMLVRPKTRRRGRTEGVTRLWKKAYVTLPKGKTIDLSA